ncbi:hypothetical protein AVEN_185592-1 [Araneus ventricosus]|uniref:Uncharacterized protein n=1 Tax=Araneus ventricosus TaxID=182803 RepID=A0A4Y2C377_ARAVE|nr:hypothetical protein AVEN_22541-1 [Araneus ventricosus]GBL98553.1 hypothetical protein AVEN_185592-1 [Araneus ventricosus]
MSGFAPIMPTSGLKQSRAEEFDQEEEYHGFYPGCAINQHYSKTGRQICAERFQSGLRNNEARLLSFDALLEIVSHK